MKKRNSLLSLVLAACLCFMLAVPALATELRNEEVDTKFNEDFFNQLRFDMIEEELQSYGIIAKDVDLMEVLPANLAKEAEVSSDTTFAFLEELVEEKIDNTKEQEKILDKLNELKKFL